MKNSKYFQNKCSFIPCRPFCPPVFLEDQWQRIRKNISASLASAVETILYHGCADLTNRTGRIVSDLDFSDADIRIHHPICWLRKYFIFDALQSMTNCSINIGN